jgi:hypothetical protein
MKILIGCEESGVVRDAFLKKGHDAWSCDLKPTRRPGKHLQMDVLKAIELKSWDKAIFFPDCTFLCSSGMHWTTRGLRPIEKTYEAVEFVLRLWNCGIKSIAVENPVGVLSTKFCKPSQIIQPNEFGEDASKETCLWLKGFPLLQPTCYIPPRMVNGKPDGQQSKPPGTVPDAGARPGGNLSGNC